MKLLLVEDETLLLEKMQQRLSEKGALVDIADSGTDGLFNLQEFGYDAVILDLGLPDISGLQVLQQLRAEEGVNQRVPVLILSARDSWQEKVAGLKSGADDYLGKPFEFEELWARLEVLARRNLDTASRDNIQFGDLSLDLNDKTLHVGAEHFNLTLTEFRLLQFFFANPNRVFSKDQLSERISDQHQDRESNVIEVYIRKLRKMIGKEPIQTLRGMGYKFVPPKSN
ncbi:response regulator transcription factor [Thiomicrorhabdus sp. 6S2-11]|uniref:Response regulator transcription factor n=1 Tax=Thiomicrorhabdus marina TaxID=2818442 RepID=A0ABS3Q4Q0_9GAMM|nr:response regulator transcription factor [Thiomicrorhabdus marina]MBO1927314.1 response regulator transcription factor [Thiomicrorhabdus marina]